MTLRIFIVVLALLSAAFAGPVPVMRVQYLIFVDQSASPGPSDAARWIDAANHKVFERLRFGDSLVVYGVHDHTGDSAPIFEAAIPVVPEDAGMDGVIGARRALRDARVNGLKSVREALKSPVLSRTTKLIESLRRITGDQQRKTEALYLSDMLESTKDLDLERIRLTDANLPTLAQAAINRYQFTRGMLDGVTVFCVLDSPRVGEPRSKMNDRSMLDRFWRLIFTTLGAQLASFDSRIQ
jgi:hypothetical protein